MKIRKFDIFISYSREDWDGASALNTHLERLGFSTWFQQGTNAEPHDHYISAMRDSSVVAFVCGNSGKLPPYTFCGDALSSRRTILVFLPMEARVRQQTKLLTRGLTYAEDEVVFEDGVEDKRALHELVRCIRGAYRTVRSLWNHAQMSPILYATEKHEGTGIGPTRSLMTSRRPSSRQSSGREYPVLFSTRGSGKTSIGPALPWKLNDSADARPQEMPACKREPSFAEYFWHVNNESLAREHVRMLTWSNAEEEQHETSELLDPDAPSAPSTSTDRGFSLFPAPALAPHTRMKPTERVRPMWWRSLLCVALAYADQAMSLCKAGLHACLMQGLWNSRRWRSSSSTTNSWHDWAHVHIAFSSPLDIFETGRISSHRSRYELRHARRSARLSSFAAFARATYTADVVDDLLQTLQSPARTEAPISTLLQSEGYDARTLAKTTSAGGPLLQIVLALQLGETLSTSLGALRDRFTATKAFTSSLKALILDANVQPDAFYRAAREINIMTEIECAHLTWLFSTHSDRDYEWTQPATNGPREDAGAVFNTLSCFDEYQSGRPLVRGPDGGLASLDFQASFAWSSRIN